MAHHLVWFANPLATGSQMGTLSTHHHDSKPPFLITSTFLGRDSKSPVRESTYPPSPCLLTLFAVLPKKHCLKKLAGKRAPPLSLRQTLSADRGYPPLFTRLVVTVLFQSFLLLSCTSCWVSKLFPCHTDWSSLSSSGEIQSASWSLKVGCANPKSHPASWNGASF